MRSRVFYNYRRAARNPEVPGSDQEDDERLVTALRLPALRLSAAWPFSGDLREPGR